MNYIFQINSNIFKKYESFFLTGMYGIENDY